MNRILTSQPARYAVKVPDFKDLLARLKHHYGAPTLPPAKGPFELILWENACYLLPDTRRQEVFEALRDQVGLTPQKSRTLRNPHSCR